MSGEQPVASQDLIGRDFTAPTPGQRLVGGDITYLRTGEGWLYLATVIDLATSLVTGWQLAAHMRTSLVTHALAMAISHGHAQPGAIFHSDRGCAVHIQRVCPVLPGSRHPHQRRQNRCVLGQRRRRIILRRPQERDVLPPGLPQPGSCQIRGRRLHQLPRLHSAFGYRTPSEALTDYQAAATAA
jgi:putative transposase